MKQFVFILGMCVSTTIFAMDATNASLTVRSVHGLNRREYDVLRVQRAALGATIKNIRDALPIATMAGPELRADLEKPLYVLNAQYLLIDRVLNGQVTDEAAKRLVLNKFVYNNQSQHKRKADILDSMPAKKRRVYPSGAPF